MFVFSSEQVQSNKPLELAEMAVNKQRAVVEAMGDDSAIAKHFLKLMEEKLEQLAQDDFLQQAMHAGIC